jgi:phage tail protein X
VARIVGRNGGARQSAFPHTRAICYGADVRSRWITVGVLFSALVCERDASGFPYVMKKGETIADVSSRFYGRVEFEKILIAANALEGKATLLPGMRLEIPAVAHHTIASSETWETIAEAYLGTRRRSEALAAANDTMPWLPPPVGREVVIPYNLRVVAKRGDTVTSLAYRYMRARDDAYILSRYNELGDDPVREGDTLLVPLWQIELTIEGREAAKRGLSYSGSEGLGDDRDAQDEADTAFADLATLIRRGEYTALVARANALLGAGTLTETTTGALHRLLLEAYVALDETALAESACAAWRSLDETAVLDPVMLSPKVLRVCTTARAGGP